MTQSGRGQFMCVRVLCTTYMYQSSFPSFSSLFYLKLSLRLPSVLLFLYSLPLPLPLPPSPSSFSLLPLSPPPTSSLRLTLHKQRSHQPPTHTGETSGRAEQLKTTLLVLTQSLPRLLASRLCASDSRICLRHQGVCVCVCVCMGGCGWVCVHVYGGHP